MEDEPVESDKRARTTEEPARTKASTTTALGNFFGVLEEADMEPPTQPTKEEMEQILLDVRKRVLLAEYGV